MDYKQGKVIEEVVHKIKRVLGFYGDGEVKDVEGIQDFLKEIKDELESIIED